MIWSLKIIYNKNLILLLSSNKIIYKKYVVEGMIYFSVHVFLNKFLFYCKSLLNHTHIYRLQSRYLFTSSIKFVIVVFSCDKDAY